MKKKMLICLSLCAVLLMSCSNGGSANSNKSTEDKTIVSEEENTSTDESTKEEAIGDKTDNNEGTATIEQPVKEEDILPEDNEVVDTNMSQKVKDYILLEQVEKPAVEQLKWSAKFLEEVDIDSLYNEYVANGGNATDVEAIAKYVTDNAPIASNWQEMFEEEFNTTYGEKISKVEYLEGDLYSAYVLKDGKEVPYVTVNARTGYYHG